MGRRCFGLGGLVGAITETTKRRQSEGIFGGYILGLASSDRAYDT